MKERTKYNNGSPIDSATVEESEMSLAVIEWSEGDEALNDAIISCMENEIPTLASCAGHKITDAPYLTIIITPQNIGRILNIMNELSEKKGVDISIDLQQIPEDEKQEQECRSILSIYGNMFNKEECFQSIANAAEKSIKPEQATPLVQAMWNAHKATRIHGRDGERLYNQICFYNGRFGKKLVVTGVKAPDIFNEAIKSTKFKKQAFDCGYSFYTLKSRKTEKIIKKLDDIAEAIQDYIIINFNDDFNYINSRGEFVKKLKVEQPATETTRDTIQNQKDTPQNETVVKDQEVEL